MSDASRVQTSYVKEVTYGVTPNSALQILRYNSENFEQSTTAVNNAEITSDRNPTGVSRTAVQAGGDITFELTYSTYDEILEGALFSAGWSSIVVVDSADTAISAAASDNSFNHTTAWANNPSVGQWIEVRGFTGDTANNGYFKVVSATGTKIVVSGGTLVDDAAGEAVTITQGAQIVNGTTQSSYSIEKEFTDLTNIFEAFTGMVPNSVSMTIPTEDKITGSFSFVGQDAASASATIGNGTHTAANTNEVFNSVDNASNPLEGGSEAEIIAGAFTTNNNLRTRRIVGSLPAKSVGSGTFNASGTVQMYFETSAIMDKYLNFTTSSIVFKLEDSAGNAYIIEFPSIKYTSGNRVAGGENTDVIADMAFSAFKHATEGITMRVARFAA